MSEGRIKSILFNLIQQNNCLDNKELYQILNKFLNSQFAEQDIVKEYNDLCILHREKYNKIEEYNKFNNYNNVFNSKGIYTINDLYRFMNNNFEYGGILIVDNERKKLPFGPVNGVANSNVMTRYEDTNVFEIIINFYNKIEPNNKIAEYVLQKYNNKQTDICSLDEYKHIINTVGGYVQKNVWKHRSVLEILNDQISNCYESTFLVGEFFKLNNVKYQKYIIGRYDNAFLSHMFITYELNGKYYYFEHALRDFKGIYEYSSKEEMEQDIFVKYIYYDNHKMDKELNLDNYFLKPIDDLNINGSFTEYFDYFATVPSIKIKKSNFDILMSLTDLVLNQVINVVSIYYNDSNVFFSDIEIPLKSDFYDLELWNREIRKILRKKIINLGFFVTNREDSVYLMNSLGGFLKFDNVIKVSNDNTRAQLIYQKQKVNNIFIIEDLEKALNNQAQLFIKKAIMFSLLVENKKDIYEYGCYFTTNLSSSCVKASGSAKKLLDYKTIDLSGKIDKNKITLSNYNLLEQMSIFSRVLEVLSESIKFLTTKDYHKDFINIFVDYFVYMIDIDSIDVEKLSNIDSDKDNVFFDKFITKLLSSILAKTNIKIN
ncbi:MAG: hypothetical protein IJO43_00880 [Bacilli bacterium]|nr:hypothetical protein [Bacilli bacterium]